LKLRNVLLETRKTNIVVARDRLKGMLVEYPRTL
jgi:hypothetical protein